MAGMTGKRFAELVASYGADPARWPQDERQPGLDLMSGDRPVADVAGQAALDRLLAGLPAPEPADAALKDRLEAVSLQPQAGDAPPAPAENPAPAGATIQERYPVLAALFGSAVPRSLIPQAAGLAMICLVGGVALGLSGFAGPGQPIQPIDPSAYFFGDPGLDKDMEELD